MKLSELALALEAELRPASHADLEVHAVASPRTAIAGKGMLVFAEDEASLQAALASQAAAILTRPTLAGDAIPARPLLLMRHPKLAFARAARLLQPPPPYTGVDSSASVHPTAQLGREVSVGPCAVIGAYTILGDRTRIEAGAVLGEGVRIGADCRIHPRAVLYPGVTLGDRVIVHAGAVLGADGFGYVRDNATGTYIQFPQQGTLVLEDDVEIGANTTIDRGALEETRIERGTKIDNLVHLGHNVRVGPNVVIAAQTGVSGSSSIGAGAVVGGQVGMGDHASIGEGVIVGSQGGILPHKHLRGPGTVFWGTPAKPLKQYLKELAHLARLARRHNAGE
ncbi:MULTISPECIES: UDP-3-O-(3-hydroxymyristoyl)glucosamine N-acyltransferase [Acidobacterium]|uniref:UDP-3-O-acylglucosamine N-acyltransferase n=1 Tax=Acidobacterium capsulatum (strain ATCC 51196 / DSM 11244 / BCRC 80197 / JCM 7670 / NBRC 15755 / NCIMB 13165 / 161) TaxID=240015 RepID=C1F6Z0_ACIC5|nr:MULTISPECIES: UDP-3-O-(3-hydroxymyristoyl)glucosamine N-acyltransferase [Acidobacterium]ACO33296.1 UDP-3-O-(3-hydroxymyristoyl) glucosamine N-acyltransferase [Acidobacterium capsulatum ATCC 51196]HCT59440.1 UDP-3-O-(3-hydroxymyristoyl)glucosamine N-acyltransferase [Acidobacterium sp.]